MENISNEINIMVPLQLLCFIDKKTGNYLGVHLVTALILYRFLFVRENRAERCVRQAVSRAQCCRVQ